MSRFSDCEFDEEFPGQAELWFQATQRAIKGKRGQALLVEMEAALMAMPEKKLISSRLCDGQNVCAVGALALHRKVSSGVPREEALAWLEKFSGDEGASETADFAEGHLKVARTLAFELAYTNDERTGNAKTDEERHEIVLGWVCRQITSRP